MKRVHRQWIGRGLLVAIVGVASAGCLVSGSNNETRTGKYVSEGTMQQIRPGETSAAWVKATLGEPSSKTKVDDRSEVWKYSYSEVKESSGAVFLIFGGSSKKQTDGAAYVELKDGVVTKAWRG